MIAIITDCQYATHLAYVLSSHAHALRMRGPSPAECNFESYALGAFNAQTRSKTPLRGLPEDPSTVKRLHCGVESCF